MKPQRKLALRSERLTDLESYDLRQVVGGTHIPTDCGCITHGLSCENCPTPTLPLNDCIADVTRTIVISGGVICEVTRSICA